jgi:NAD(P)-dependent dehydrogenase (short-subunit alcohol dehydrogenase family)
MTQHILITGCSSGFGLDAARHLARQGHHVHATMRNVNSKNQSVAGDLRAFADIEGVSLTVHDMDVTSDASVEAAVAEMPIVDVLINNAGLGYGGPVESFTSEQVLQQLDLNIVGTFRVAKAVLPGMRKRKSGLIIQVSSTAGRAAFPGFGVYHASKWGLEGMSEAMRYELAPLGIDVVIVEPGPFSTNFLSNLVEGADAERASSYSHVATFFEGFTQMVTEAFQNEDAPTDPMVVVETFERLIEMAPGERPLRTIAGLDFGLQAVNDAVEPIRKQSLESMQIGDWDGPVPVRH